MCIYLDKYYSLTLFLAFVRSMRIDYDVVLVRSSFLFIKTAIIGILSCTSRPTVILSDYFIVEI